MVFKVCLCMGSIQIYYISLYDKWGKRDIPILLVDVGCIFSPSIPAYPIIFGGFLKWEYPQIIHFCRIFWILENYKPSILETFTSPSYPLGVPVFLGSPLQAAMAARAARDPTPRWALRNKPPHRPWPITTTSRAAWVVSEDSPNIPSQVRIDLGLLEIDPKIDNHKGI